MSDMLHPLPSAKKFLSGRPGLKVRGVTPLCLGDHDKPSILRLTSLRSDRLAVSSEYEREQTQSASMYMHTAMRYNMSCADDY